MSENKELLRKPTPYVDFFAFYSTLYPKIFQEELRKQINHAIEEGKIAEKGRSAIQIALNEFDSTIEISDDGDPVNSKKNMEHKLAILNGLLGSIGNMPTAQPIKPINIKKIDIESATKESELVIHQVIKEIGSSNRKNTTMLRIGIERSMGFLENDLKILKRIQSITSAKLTSEAVKELLLNQLGADEEGILDRFTPTYLDTLIWLCEYSEQFKKNRDLIVELLQFADSDTVLKYPLVETLLLNK